MSRKTIKSDLQYGYMKERFALPQSKGLTRTGQTFYPGVRSIVSMASGDIGGEIPRGAVGPSAKIQPRVPQPGIGIGRPAKTPEASAAQGPADGEKARIAQIREELNEVAQTQARPEGSKSAVTPASQEPSEADVVTIGEELLKKTPQTLRKERKEAAAKIPEELTQKAEEAIRAKSEKYGGVQARGQLGAAPGEPEEPAGNAYDETLDRAIRERRERQEAERGEEEGGLGPIGTLTRVIRSGIDGKSGIDGISEIKKRLKDENRDATTEEEQDLRDFSEVVRDAIEQLPLTHSEYIGGAIREIVRDDEMADYFLDRIISYSDSKPSSQYKIDFFTESTKVAFGVALKEEGGLEDTERPKRFAAKEEAREYFHNIHWALKPGNMESYTQLASTVNDEFFDAATDHVGVATVDRLYDVALRHIYSQKNTLEPDDFRKVEKWVEARFLETARGEARPDGTRGRPTLLNTKYEYERPLEDWEIRRALTVGRNFFFVKIRGGELLALADVANTGGAQQWQSYSYESLVRLVNPVRALLQKFAINPVQGGQKMNEYLLKELKEANTDLEANQLDMIARFKRSDFELASPLGKVGFDYGWRVLQGHARAVPLKLTKDEYDDLVREEDKFKEKFPDKVRGEPVEVYGRDQEGNVYVDAGRFADSRTRLIDDFHKMNEHRNSKGEKDALERERMGMYNDKLAPIVDQLDFNLGLFLGVTELPIEMKTKLWRKAARFVPLAVAHFLPRERDLVLRANGIDMTTKDGQTRWEAIERKIIQLQELRVLAAEEANAIPQDPQHFLERYNAFAKFREKDNLLDWYDMYEAEKGHVQNDEKSVQLTEGERNVIGRIINLGEEEASVWQVVTDKQGDLKRDENDMQEYEKSQKDGKDVKVDREKFKTKTTIDPNKVSNIDLLARVAWPNSPFMDDTLVDIDYARLGTEFARRRIVDAVAYYKAGQELLAVFTKPAMEIKTAIDHFENAMTELDAPHPRPSAQKYVLPFIKAHMSFRRKRGEDSWPWKWGWDRTPGISGIRRALRVNQSDAQDAHGHTAPADDADDEYEISQVLARRGIITRGGKDDWGKEVPSQLEDLRKKLGARAVNLFIHLFKVFGPLVLFILPYEFIKALREAK